MSPENQDLQSPTQHEKIGLTTTDTASSETVNSASRRKLTRFGLGAPVVLTLASRSVLAGQCLSNMLSGNLSNPTRNSWCSKGANPDTWAQPGGTVTNLTTLQAWAKINFNYGTFDSTLPGCSIPGSTTKAVCYKGGATIANLPFASLNPDGAPGNRTLLEVLNDQSNFQNTRFLVCAYFNAKLSGASGGAFHYILTEQEVVDLANKTLPVPPTYSSLSAFLATTW